MSDAQFLSSTNVRLIFLISMVSSTGAIVSPALPAMSAGLDVPEARIGLVFTAFTLPAILALPLVGGIADMYGRKIVVVPGLVVFGVAGVAVGFVHDFAWILVLRGVQGIGYTAFNSVAVALLGDELSGTQESAAQGTRVLLNKTAGFVGPTVAGILASIAWEYPFYLYAVAIPTGVLSYWYLQTGRDTGTQRARSATRSPALRAKQYTCKVGHLLGNPFIASILIAGFVRLFMKYALLTYLPLIVVLEYGGSIALAGLLVGTYNLVGAVTASQSARLTTALTPPYALLFGFVVAAIALLGIPFVYGVVGISMLTVVHGIGEGIINPVHKSVMTQSVDRTVRAGLVASNAMVQNVAKTIAPVVIVPLLIFVDEPVYSALFGGIGAVTLALAGAAVIFLRSSRLVPRTVDTE